MEWYLLVLMVLYNGNVRELEIYPERLSSYQCHAAGSDWVGSIPDDRRYRCLPLFRNEKGKDE